jgi:CHAT domain-containing protein
MKKEMGKAQEELDGMRREIRYRNPLYASVQYPEPVALQTLQEEVLAKNEVLIAYFLSGKGAYCFVVWADGYELVRLPVAHAALERRVKDLLGKIREGGMVGLRYPAEDAARLYEALVQPVESYLEGRDVIVVPDGVLALLPFEALIAKEKEGRSYLIEKYPLKYVQSASVLGILRTQYKKEGTNYWFIGFGDPVYDYKNFKQGRPEGVETTRGDKAGKARSLVRGGYLRSGGSLSRLEGSGKEVSEIENIFRNRSKQAKSFLRAQAREEQVKSSSLEQYGFIHFSTHGIVDDNFQAIALSQIPDSKEDGFFTLGEIMNSRFNAQLVTLSACETGLGKTDRGEGITGLTRAVMYAGSPAAVVSLWSVSDEKTKELMVLFYKNMINEGMTKETALRRTKIELIKASSHPFFWAPFVMYGE